MTYIKQTKRANLSEEDKKTRRYMSLCAKVAEYAGILGQQIVAYTEFKEFRDDRTAPPLINATINVLRKKIAAYEKGVPEHLRNPNPFGRSPGELGELIETALDAIKGRKIRR